MPKTLKALISTTEAALQRETDPSQLRILEAKLGTLQARAEMDDDDDDDKKGKDGDGDGDDDSKSAKHAKRAEKLKAKARATELRSKAAEHKGKAAEYEEEAKKCEEEASGEEGEEEARLHTPTPTAQTSSLDAQALIEAATGRKGAAALGAAQALFSMAAQTSDRVARLEKERTAEKRAALMAEARKLCFGNAEAAWLATQPLASIEGFVEMRRAGGAVIHTDEGTLIKPRAAEPGSMDALPPDVQAMVDDACAHADVDDRDALRKALIETHTKQLARAANGAAAGGRY
jgi:hypothetical protein